MGAASLGAPLQIRGVNVEPIISNDSDATQILPELSAESVDELPILKADALKFVTLLRGQLPTAALLGAFGALIRLLGADSNVVHSYAAVAIERLLASKVCS